MTALSLLPLVLAFQSLVLLPETLENWKREIEAQMEAPIRIVEQSLEQKLDENAAEAAQPSLAEEDAALLAAYLANPAFHSAFSRSQALTLNVRSEGRLRPFILLNRGLLERSRNVPAILVAHELGHLWLQAQGFFPPRFQAGPQACLAIHIGDIVQHELIRRELDRRVIEWRPAYQKDYEAAAANLREKPVSGPGGECLRAQRLSLMVDLINSYPPEGQDWRDEYFQILARQDPDAEAVAKSLAAKLGAELSLDKESYQSALAETEAAVLGLTGR